MTTVAASRRPLWVGAAVSWAAAAGVQLSGKASGLHHGEVLSGSILAFIAVWQAHVALVMLPSSLPMVRAFGRVTEQLHTARAAKSAFVGGYAVVWTVFGTLAFAGDRALHAVGPKSLPAGVVPGLALLTAGAFQFTGLKDRCLRVCRRPETFLRAHYGRGLPAAFRLGGRHGLFCLGCCWALMAVMFTIGLANLMWMAPLAAVMFVERTIRGGAVIVRPVGWVLVSLGAAVLMRSAA